MSWFNYYGLIIIVFLMIPNIIMAIRHKEAFVNQFNCPKLKIAEQIGRYGSFILMIFNIPFTYVGWFFGDAEMVYLIVNGALLVAYELIWIIMRNKNNLVRAILLSGIPSAMFVFSGIMILSIPLILFSILFAVCHITISVKNANCLDRSLKKKRNAIITVVSLVMAFAILGGSSYGAVILKSAIPFMKSANMTAAEMLEYDVKNSDNIISVAIVKNGEITYTTYGAKAKEGTLYNYEIGSISKTFLGLVFSKLISENKVSLDDSISEYLALDKDAYYPTIGRLLTHTSGYQGYYFEASMIPNKLSHTTTNDFYGVSKKQLLDRVKAIRLEDRDYPFCYSNFGISVLGLVLEEIYGRSYTDIMNDYIQNELSLGNSAVAKQSGNLDGYWKWKPDDAYIPAGSVISDIRDMAKYLQICMTADGYIENSFHAVKPVNANNPTYMEFGIRIDSVGMTWMRDEENGYVWHNGSTTDFNSYFAFDRETGTGVVLLGNLGSSERITLTVIGAKLMSELTNEIR